MTNVVNINRTEYVPPKVVDERAVAANKVHAQFAHDSLNFVTVSPHMAGFSIVAWDDEGTMSSVYYRGENDPFAPMLIPDMVRDMVKADVILPIERK